MLNLAVSFVNSLFPLIMLDVDKISNFPMYTCLLEDGPERVEISGKTCLYEGKIKLKKKKIVR